MCSPTREGDSATTAGAGQTATACIASVRNGTWKALKKRPARATVGHDDFQISVRLALGACSSL